MDTNNGSIKLTDNSLRFAKGSLFLISDELNIKVKQFIKHYIDNKLEEIAFKNNSREKRDGENYHITVINVNEMKGLDKDAITDAIKKIENSEIDLHLLTLGSVSHQYGSFQNIVFYITVLSNTLQYLRNSVGIVTPANLHITISFNQSDIHDKPKDLESTYRISNEWLRNVLINIKNFVKTKCYAKSQYYLDTLKWFCKWYHPDDIKDVNVLCDVILQIYKTEPKIIKENLEFIDELCLRDKLIGLYIKCKHIYKEEGINKAVKYLQDSVSPKYILNTYECSDKIINNILGTLNYPINNCKSWLQNIDRRKLFQLYRMNYNKDKGTITFVPSDLPRNFSFVSNKYAGSSIIKQSDIPNFVDIGINCTITLMERKVFQDDSDGCEHLYYYVDDRTPPSKEQLLDIIDKIKDKNKVLVHCQGGVGRTATVLVALLMYDNHISLSDALIKLEGRKTILSKSQEEFLKDWYVHVMSTIE